MNGVAHPPGGRGVFVSTYLLPKVGVRSGGVRSLSASSDEGGSGSSGRPFGGEGLLKSGLDVLNEVRRFGVVIIWSAGVTGGDGGGEKFAGNIFPGSPFGTSSILFGEKDLSSLIPDFWEVSSPVEIRGFVDDARISSSTIIMSLPVHIPDYSDSPWKDSKSESLFVFEVL